MSEGFKGFAKKQEDDDFVVNINNNEVDKLIKQYKKLKKYQKSNMYEVARLSNIDTILEKLINEYGIDAEAIE